MKRLTMAVVIILTCGGVAFAAPDDKALFNWFQAVLKTLQQIQADTTAQKEILLRIEAKLSAPTTPPAPAPKPPFQLSLGNGQECSQNTNCGVTATNACKAIGYKSGGPGKTEPRSVWRHRVDGGTYDVKILLDATCTDA